MQPLADRITAANALLVSSAVPHEGTLGRVFPEDPDATRFPFQRDRDRIIHSRAFRRLKGKTQVFISGSSDHFRTRLTHTMEVAQISRDMARTLGLNEDLAECIALAHDLGHPPFGHAGEDALNDWMQRHGSRFEHNEQSLRIVTILDHRTSQYTGLNLNKEVLEGLMKHPTSPSALADELRGASRTPLPPSFEAQIVNIADEIAYTGHDIDDGLRAALFTVDDLQGIDLIDEALQASTEHDTSLRGALIHMLVMDIYAQDTQSIAFSSAMRSKLDALRYFLWDNMYMHPHVAKKADNGKKIVTDLCNHLLLSPSDKVDALMQKHDCERFEAVKDYVAGMTDTFATQMFETESGKWQVERESR